MTTTEGKCEHVCSGNCRREGCNCACGEFHTPKDESWQDRFREYFSANALDGEDIDHGAQMIAPSLAVEVATDFFSKELERQRAELAQRIEWLPPISGDLRAYVDAVKKNGSFDGGFDYGYVKARSDAAALIRGESNHN